MKRVAAGVVALLLVGAACTDVEPDPEECARLQQAQEDRALSAATELSRLIEVNEQQITNALRQYARIQRAEERTRPRGGDRPSDEPSRRPGIEARAWGAIAEANDRFKQTSVPVGCE